MKSKYLGTDNDIHVGKGITFHIAPSNVPVNFAYSMVSAIMTGNSVIVRVPSKKFVQIDIIVNALKKTLSQYEEMLPYVCLVRYEKNKQVNDLLSSLADVRIVWGGDNTINELRQSLLSPRSSEITFADRFSIAVIDADRYLCEEPQGVALEFYNDTYLTDQNACTSPILVAWTGKEKELAKKRFWHELEKIVIQKYVFQDIQGVNKLTNSYLLVAEEQNNDIKLMKNADNLIVRVLLSKLDKRVIDYKSNCGYFFEYDFDDILELRELCNHNQCQTIGYIGEKDMFMPLLLSGVRGIDRIVPIGHMMDFELLWDGYNLFERFTRVIILK